LPCFGDHHNGDFLLDKSGGLHIRYVKAVGTHFALLFVELSLLCCKNSNCNKERLKHHPDVEASWNTTSIPLFKKCCVAVLVQLSKQHWKVELALLFQ
jgi:hypothetical protein